MAVSIGTHFFFTDVIGYKEIAEDAEELPDISVSGSLRVGRGQIPPSLLSPHY